jgi:hypothetical protein
MTVEFDVKVVGIKEALRELNRVDKSLRRQITEDYKQVVAGIVQDAQQGFPTSFDKGRMPSGFARTWVPGRNRVTSRPRIGRGGVFSDSPDAVRAGLLPYPGPKGIKVRAFLSGKKPREFAGFYSNLATFGVRVDSPTGTLFDIAGRGSVPTKQGRQMTSVLTQRSGQPSRIMWPTVIKGLPKIERELERVVNRVMQAVSRNI